MLGAFLHEMLRSENHLIYKYVNINIAGFHAQELKICILYLHERILNGACCEQTVEPN